MRDRGSRGLIFFSVSVAIVISFSFSYSGIAQLPDWLFYPGVSLMLLGIVIRQWAIAVLGRFFSLTVRVAEDHKVVEKGPYQFVRHPSYTGALVTFVGLGLAVQSWAALLCLLLMSGLVYGYRIWVEERTLGAELGSDYLSYMKRRNGSYLSSYSFDGSAQATEPLPSVSRDARRRITHLLRRLPCSKGLGRPRSSFESLFRSPASE